MAGPSSNTAKEGRTAKSPGFRINGIVAGISLMLAIFLWLLITLRTQTFRTTLSYPVSVAHMPPGVELASGLPERVTFLSEGKGNHLIVELLKFYSDTIVVDYRRYGRNGYVSFTDFGNGMNGAKARGISFLSASPDSVFMKFDRRYTRKSVVEAITDLTESGVFRVKGEAIVIPDSVTLQGPEEIVSKMDICRTLAIKVPKQTGKMEIPVQLSLPKTVKSFPDQVSVQVETERFTEKRIKVHVQAVNVPRNTRLQLTPEEVEVVLLVPESDFADISAEDLTITADYRSLREGSRFLIPDVKIISKVAEFSKLKPETLNYLIIRE